MIRTYTELRALDSFDDRYAYLKLGGVVGRETFGFDRYMNQQFYRSKQWRDIRNHVIARDLGCDLGVEGYDVYENIHIHHMNPMNRNELIEGSPDILDPEYLITVSFQTHNAIHYGTANTSPKPFAERSPGDTKLW